MRATTLASLIKAFCFTGGMISLSFSYIIKSTDSTDSSDYLIWAGVGLVLILLGISMILKRRFFNIKRKSFYKL
jgi:hypothetical protein